MIGGEEHSIECLTNPEQLDVGGRWRGELG